MTVSSGGIFRGILNIFTGKSSGSKASKKEPVNEIQAAQSSLRQLTALREVTLQLKDVKAVKKTAIYKEYLANHKGTKLPKNIDEFSLFIDGQISKYQATILGSDGDSQDDSTITRTASLAKTTSTSVASSVGVKELESRSRSGSLARTESLSTKYVISKFFPLSGVAKNESMLNAEKVLDERKYSRVEIPVEVLGDARTLEAWHKVVVMAGGIDGPTVVIFHANGMTGAQMYSQAQFYLDLGFNVLLPTMGGYPGSPGVETSEASIYQDVEAIKLYLQTKQVNNVGYHGLSIGGSLAFQAGSNEGSKVPLNTLFVVGDQTFTDGVEAAVNLVKNKVLRGLATTVRKYVAPALPTGNEVDLPGGGKAVTDALNNLVKVKALAERKVPLFFIETPQDVHMGIGKREKSGIFTQTMSTELHRQTMSSPVELDSPSGVTHIQSSLYRLDEGGHCTPFTVDEKASDSLYKDIKKIRMKILPGGSNDITSL